MSCPITFLAQDSAFVGYFLKRGSSESDPGAMRMVFRNRSNVDPTFSHILFKYVGPFVVDMESEDQINPPAHVGIVKEVTIDITRLIKSEVTFSLESWDPIYVAHEQWFEERFIIAREGMSGIFRISKWDLPDAIRGAGPDRSQFPLNHSFFNCLDTICSHFS